MAQKRMEEIKSFLDVGVAVLGVLAAFFAVFSLYYGNRLDAIKKIEEERLKTRVAEANAEAEMARTEVAKANENISKTDLKAQELQLQVQEQKEKANSLSLEVEIQKEKAINAEKDLLLLREKIKPRNISLETKQWLVQELKQYHNKKIRVSSPIGDSEASFYADQFVEIFEEAGWNVDSEGLSFKLGVSGLGAYICTKDSKNADAILVQDIFKEKGIFLKGNLTMVDQPDIVEIFIGSKSNDLDNHD